MANTIIQARIDQTAKAEAEAILGKLGITLSEGIRMFVNQVRINKALPFTPSLHEKPNDKLTEALKFADEYFAGNNINIKSFSSADAALADLLDNE